MDFHIPDYVRVTIEGNSVTPYIVSYTRKDDLCELGVSFSLQLSLTCPYTINPYDDVLIEELYGGSSGYVLRGYIVELNKNFEEGLLTIQGLDKSLLLNDYFIPQTLTSHGQTVNYWINYLVGLTGLSTHFDATSTYIVEDETPLGFQTVADAVLSLERQAAYYAKYDSQNDYVRIFRLGSSQTVLTIATDDVVDAKRSVGTENTRNVVKIYGGYKYNILDGSSTQVFAKARSNIPELLVDKTSVIVSPVLRSQTYAYIVANRILSVVNSIDDEQLYMLAGFYPTVHVGEGTYIDVNFANLEYHGNRMITSIETSVNSDGAFTTVGVGKKCPRISVNLPDPPVFVTTTTDGVGVSWDGGDNFSLSNIGLTNADAKDAWSIAVNQYGQSMVLTTDGLYRRWGTGGVWTKVTGFPNDPLNESNDFIPTLAAGITLAKVVEEPTRYNKFHVLAQRKWGPFFSLSGWYDRTWIYSTRNFGYTWNCKQLYVTQAPNLLCPSGISWNVYGCDIESSPTNNVYVLVNGGTNAPPTPRFVGVGGTWPNDLRLGYQKPGEAFVWSTNKAKPFWGPSEKIRAINVYTSLYNRDYSWCLLLTDEGYDNFYLNARVWKTANKGETWYLTLNQKIMYPAVYFKTGIDDPSHMYVMYYNYNKYMLTRPQEIFFDYLGTLGGGSIGKGPAHWRIPVYSTKYQNTFDRTKFNIPGATFEFSQDHFIGYIEIYESIAEINGPLPSILPSYTNKNVYYLINPSQYAYPVYWPYDVSNLGSHLGLESWCSEQTRYATRSIAANSCLYGYWPLFSNINQLPMIRDYDGVNELLTSDLTGGAYCAATGHPFGNPPAGYSYNTREAYPYGYYPYYNHTAHNTAYAKGIYFQKGKRGAINTLMYTAAGRQLQVYPGFETIPFELLTFDVSED